MNIFFLDLEPAKAVEYHNDKHVVKMILETAQLLSTAHHLLSDGLVAENIYKPTHKNHPSAIWVRQSSENYLWAHSLLVGLCSEYTFRYNKVHKTERTGIVKCLSELPSRIPVSKFTMPPTCMPDEYKQSDVVQSYRNYYIGSKSHIAFWKVRGKPAWYN